MSRSNRLSQRAVLAPAVLVVAAVVSPNLRAADVVGDAPARPAGERADPSQDAGVTTLLNQQGLAARRIADAQTDNVQGRLQQLHGDDSAVCDRPERAPARVSIAGESTEAPGQAASLPTPPPVSAAAANRVAPSTPPSGASPVSLALSACQRSSVATAWTGGALEVGAGHAPVGGQGLGLHSRGVTLGADHRIAPTVVLGVGIGLARERADAVGEGVWNGADALAAIVYLGYRPTPALFIDALAGHGDMQMRSERGFAERTRLAAERPGSQRFASLAAGYRLEVAGAALAPYTRLDALQATLHPTAEAAGGADALQYQSQSVPSLKLALGVEGSSRIETRFGPLSPRGKVEMRHELDAAGGAAIAYADSPTGPVYAVEASATPRTAWSAGFGATLALRDQWSIGAGYAFDRAASGSSNRLDFTLTRQLR